MPTDYRAVAFDLLTALLDSWTSWGAAAGSPDLGRQWRLRYLEVTYGAGRYRDYRALIEESANLAGVPRTAADHLVESWTDLAPWPEAGEVLRRLASRVPLAIVTNCSESLAEPLVSRLDVPFASVVTAERAGWYKPRPEPYRMALAELGLDPSRVLFVAGSPNDIGGAGAVGMPVFWHNRLGLPDPDPERPAGILVGAAGSLRPLPDLVGC